MTKTTKTVAFETHNCKTKLEIKKETLDEIELQRGLEIMDKFDNVPIRYEVQDNFNSKIYAKKETKSNMEKKKGLEIVGKLDTRIRNEIQNFKIEIKKEAKGKMGHMNGMWDHNLWEIQEGLEMIDKLDVCIRNEIKNFKKGIEEEMVGKLDPSVRNEIQHELKPKVEIKEAKAVQRGLEIIEKLDPPTKKPKLEQVLQNADMSNEEIIAEMKRQTKKSVQDFVMSNFWSPIIAEETQRLLDGEKRKIYIQGPKETFQCKRICEFLKSIFRGDLKIFNTPYFIQITYGRSSWLNEDLKVFNSGLFHWPHNCELVVLRDSNLVLDDLKFRYDFLKDEIKETELVIHNVTTDIRYEDLVKVFPNLKDFSKSRGLKEIKLYFNNVKDALEAFHSGKDVLIGNWKVNAIFNRWKDSNHS